MSYETYSTNPDQELLTKVVHSKHSVKVHASLSGRFHYHDPNARTSWIGTLFPHLRSTFGWEGTRERRDSEPPEMIILKPGIFSSHVLKDSISFTWLSYIDEDGDIADIDYTSQYINEYANIGLLSALVFTVWVAFQTQPLNFDPAYSQEAVNQMKIAYAIVWTMASGSVLFATICSIILILAINQSAGPAESEHFMRLFNDSTFGLGSFIPLILLYTSVIEGSWGTMLWYLINYQSYEIAIIVLFTLSSLTCIFVYFTLQICSSLYASRHTNRAIMQLPKVTLSSDELRSFFKRYVDSVGGIQYIDSEDKYIDFIRVNAGIEGFKCKLTMISERVARKYYNDQIDKIGEDMVRGMEDKDRQDNGEASGEGDKKIEIFSSENSKTPNGKKEAEKGGSSSLLGLKSMINKGENKVVPIDTILFGGPQDFTSGDNNHADSDNAACKNAGNIGRDLAF